MPHRLPPMPLAPAGYRWIKSRRKPWRVVAAVAVLGIIYCGCASKGPPRAVPIPRPAESRAVAPQAERVRQQIGAMGNTLADLRGGLNAAVVEADRLRKQKSANEAELTRMWAVLTEEQARATALWDQLAESQLTVDELNRAALERDIEIDALRKTVDELNTQLKAANEWQREAGPKVAIYDWCRSNIRWLLVGLALSGTAYLVVRYLLPLLAAVGVKALKPFP